MPQQELPAPHIPHTQPKYGLPVTVGVTGHRDLKDPDVVRAELQQQFAMIQNRLPSSPLYAISALAEGADRIFAQVAIEMNWELHVVLPMRPDLYRDDFATEASKKEFDTLCRSAKTCVVMPTVVPGTEDRITEAGLYRNLQYASAGIYLAQRSHILFALWDGQPAVGLGGTAQIVSFRREGALSLDTLHNKEEALTPEILNLLYSANPLEERETGLVAIIYCARETQRGEAPVVSGKQIMEIEWTDGARRADSFYNLLRGHEDHDDSNKAGMTAQALRLLRRNNSKEERMRMGPILNDLNKINQDIEKRVTVNPNLFDKDWGYNDVKEMFRTQNLNTKVILDNIVSEKMQKSRFGLGFVFIVIGVFVLISSRSPGDPEGWLLISTTLSLILLACLIVLTKKTPWLKDRDNAIQLRAIVQGLVVQDFWNIAGIRDGVFQHYMRYEGAIVRSTRFFLQGTGFAKSYWNHSDAAGISASQASVVIDYVTKNWIDGQINYYANTVRRKEKRKRLLSFFGKFLFSTGVLFLIITEIRLYGLIDFGNIIPHAEIIMHLIEHGSETLVALGAVALTYLEFVGDEEDAETYERAKEIFTSAKAEIIRNLPSAPEDGSLWAFRAHNLRTAIYCLGVDILNSDTARWVERSLKQKIDLMKG